MGSSCFSRGNKKNVHLLQQYLKERKLEDNVLLKGTHCMDQCDKGPMMEIDGELIYHLTEESISEILDQKLGLTSL